MCSTTRGPAIWPSLVTWPTRITAAPVRLAKRISSPAEPRTCVTVPGAASSACVHIVWIESITSKLRHRTLRQRRDDVLDRSFRRNLDRGIGETEPLGAQPHLRDSFLAGDVNRALAAARERGRDLDQQRRFADARIAAEQQHRAAHQPAAGDAVEFGDARGEPRRFLRLALERLDGEQPAFARRTRRRRGAFLDERIPLAACFATAGPARRGGAAVLTDEVLRARRHLMLSPAIDRGGSAGRGG